MDVGGGWKLHRKTRATPDSTQCCLKGDFDRASLLLPADDDDVQWLYGKNQGTCHERERGEEASAKVRGEAKGRKREQ